ncbi:hypothetical protein FB561_4039 [Kribbella amoyensis]|uniref:Uncharacterized protein n=1 Tax=Kribbella amoyensis TaxID=996641 RepID=A0A561BVN6_9ACTN|nr:hypothetical protein [Kribbella amoyensis]TWD82893.1 hypothetical protein FB561_4039 [Kribbella amoyensis]
MDESSFAEINGHRVVAVPLTASGGRVIKRSLCVICDTQFADRLAIEERPCPGIAFGITDARGHDLFADPDFGILFCTRCELVAVDQADLNGEPRCPRPAKKSGPTDTPHRANRSSDT